MFLACFASINIHEAKAVAANHVSPTLRVIVTSCVMRCAHGLISAASRIASRKIGIRHAHLQHLFYFISDLWTVEIK